MGDYFNLGAEQDLCRSGSTVVVISSRLEKYKVSVFFIHKTRSFFGVIREAKETSDS